MTFAHVHNEVEKWRQYKHAVWGD